MKRNFLSASKVVSIILAICFILGSVVPVFAYNDENYETAGFNFLINQYELKDIGYNSIEKQDSICLYDTNDNIIAKMLVVNRDNHIDYVVLDFLTDRIDEFGFDQEDFVLLFSSHEKILYAGLMNYAYYDNGTLK